MIDGSICAWGGATIEICRAGSDRTMMKTVITGLVRGACAATLFAGTYAAAWAAPGDAGTTAAPAQPTIPADLRNVRYCEVITVVRQRLTFNVDVYNTLGLNLCPAEQWSALNAKALAKQLKVGFVKLNGPRYWTLDKIEAKGASASGETATFGSIGMVHRATLQTKIWEGTVGDKFYTPNTVKRTTVFHYKAGAPVYELVAPNGDIYMMQSYAQIADPTLSIGDLPNLGQRLKLPKGWTYRTRVLDSDYALVADRTTYVINDDLYNSYQRRAK
jgi:hypothetical protein